ncbi:hypothetical protein [Deferribacter abyssi]|uniref:hypothetical protein n=1 Tax=Deferribacter abyssi TaxID=213806 RepID=UPI003C147987
MKKHFLFLFLSLFVVFSCTKIDNVKFGYSNDFILKKVYEQNEQVCNIKGKFFIYYEDRFFKLKFKCALMKDCNNNVKMFVFGLLNQVLATVHYDGTKVVVLEKNKDISKEYAGILNKDKIERIITLFNVPIFLPKDILKKEVQGDYLYVYDSNKIFYKIDRNFKIVEIKTDEFDILYQFKNELLKKIDYVDFSLKLFITFL